VQPCARLFDVSARSTGPHVDPRRAGTSSVCGVVPFTHVLIFLTGRFGIARYLFLVRSAGLAGALGHGGAAQGENIPLTDWLVVTVALQLLVIHIFCLPGNGASEVPAGVRDREPEPSNVTGVKVFNGGNIMRWSFWPVSITLHIALGIAALVVPLLADVAPPAPAPIHMFLAPTMTAPVPDVVIAQAPRAPTVTPANVVAPTGFAPEPKDEPKYFGPPAIDVPAAGGADLGMIGSGADTRAVVAPPPPPPTPKPAQTVFRPGQGIKEPKRISGLPPEYPKMARDAHVEGVVILEAIIDERGEVGRIKLLRSQPLLDQAAISAVQQWRYTPTLLNGVPVSVLMTITVNFTLQK